MSERDGRRLSRRGLLRLGAPGLIAASAGCSGLGGGSAPLGDEAGSESYTLTVVLEDESGEPALDASVSVQSTQLVPQAEAQVPGSDGIVRFDLENGEYIVLVESQVFASVEESVTIDGEDRRVTITLRPGYG